MVITRRNLLRVAGVMFVMPFHAAAKIEAICLVRERNASVATWALAVRQSKISFWVHALRLCQSACSERG